MSQISKSPLPSFLLGRETSILVPSNTTITIVLPVKSIGDISFKSPQVNGGEKLLEES